MGEHSVSSRTRRLLFPSISAIVMLAMLIGLGTWQVERLHWKEAILTRIAQAEAAPPVPLDASPDAWTKVNVTGDMRNDLSARYGAEVRDTRAGPAMGSQLIVPLMRAGAPPLLVDRGWMPDSRPQPLEQPAGPVTVTGYIRPGDSARLFSAADDVAGRRFFTLDPAVIGRALGLPSVAPFILVAMGPQVAEHWPAPALHLPQPANNHLSYAITWYGLAATLIVVFVIWVRKTLLA